MTLNTRFVSSILVILAFLTFLKIAPPGRNGMVLQQKASLTEAQAMELARLRRWKKDITRCDSLIAKLRHVASQATVIKGAGGSLQGAQKTISELRECESRLDTLIPDAESRAGVMKLKLSLAQVKQYLVLVDASPQLLEEARRNLAWGTDSLAKWKAHYGASKQRFVKSLDL